MRGGGKWSESAHVMFSHNHFGVGIEARKPKLCLWCYEGRKTKCRLHLRRLGIKAKEALEGYIKKGNEIEGGYGRGDERNMEGRKKGRK